MLSLCCSWPVTAHQALDRTPAGTPAGWQTEGCSSSVWFGSNEVTMKWNQNTLLETSSRDQGIAFHLCHGILASLQNTGVSGASGCPWIFSALMRLFPTSAHESMCWKSFIFEVIWNLFHVIIVSGHPPKHARKGADIAKDYPGEENKMLSVVTRGDKVGTSHTSRFTALPTDAEPQSCLQEWCQSGKGLLDPSPLPWRELGMGDCAGRTWKQLWHCPGFAVPVVVVKEGQKATCFLPPPVTFLCFFPELEGFMMCLYRAGRLHLK